MHREGEETPPEGRERPIRATGAERGRRRGLEPAERPGVGDADGSEGEHGLGQVGAGDLRRVPLGAPLEVSLRVEAETDAGAGAPGPASPLDRKSVG